MSRKKSREIAFKLLFPFAFDGIRKQNDGVSFVDNNELELATDAESGQPTEKTIDAKEMQYINKLYDAAISNLDKIDEIISSTAKGFSFDRIYKVDLTALRLAVAEILYLPETPAVVAINETVNLVKKYGTEASAGYVNGILASIIKNQRNE